VVYFYFFACKIRYYDSKSDVVYADNLIKMQEMVCQKFVECGIQKQENRITQL
jgi:hypothetical protein